MSKFSEYTEELNDTVMYGVMYKFMMSTPHVQASEVTPEIEERLTLRLKIDAIQSIKNEITDEYFELKEQYDRLDTERKELE